MMIKTARNLKVAAGRTLQRFCADDNGEVAIEYGLIVGLIVVAIIATVLSIGETLRDDYYGTVSEGLTAAAGS